jgi:hypothetical protein
MHSDIRSDVQLYPQESRAAQQRELDKWRQEFNHVRPHQALGGKTPGEVYQRSAHRCRHLNPVHYAYQLHVQVCKVSRGGHICFEGQSYFVSASLSGHEIGLERQDAVHAKLWFRDIDLGMLDINPKDIDITIERCLPEVFTRTHTCQPVVGEV